MSMKVHTTIVIMSVCFQNAADRHLERKEKNELYECMNVSGEHRRGVYYSLTHFCPSCKNMLVFVLKENSRNK